MRMTSALDVDVSASAADYRAFHAGWDDRLAKTADTLSALRPDLLLSDVPYLPLAAASRVGIPAVAMSSLNWADIYRHYCGHLPEAGGIHAQILLAYNSAQCFLRTEPGMPMTDIALRRTIGPIARAGRQRRKEIERAAGIGAGEKLVVVSFGGIPFHIDIGRWPRLPGVRWLTRRIEGNNHPDCIDIGSLGMPYADIVCSSDALIGKPGYGTFAEAVCNGIPMLYVRRPGWPEEPCLVDWLQQHGNCLEIQLRQLESGDIASSLEHLLAQKRKPPVAPGGIDEAATYLAEML
jgi:hypothetical protein